MCQLHLTDFDKELYFRYALLRDREPSKVPINLPSLWRPTAAYASTLVTQGLHSSSMHGLNIEEYIHW